ncbi:Putative gamma-glutamyltransferase YwrD; AltName: Full=Glutathione hydrolase; Contains: RecName: Full=Gamma-glutamyltranspeptidase large chain; Contains: RecName: Full=Gamma-glutamyltranspeptidase small chain [Serendipita indica DSM 11827]|nr:Putative gamma-glutamyltransferase YwrD; AltName: Full=Glutathione hydrolase; Contains: RecName: Full=Gamma-glutamyltranspeptidase large chain; Contains: RecName: Full=Gamma-glutamyltranspeptidase small chain [Serendipita indica DSM 11827]
MDAAVATSIALNVTEPSCCGIGGDAFALFYDAKTKKVHALNGSGRSPRALTVEKLRERGIVGNTIPYTDLNSVTVPGAAAAWVDSVEMLGSGKVSFAEVAAPAIRLAEEGVPVSEVHSLGWQRSEKILQHASPNGDAMLLNGRAPRPGEVMRFPDLASTFKALVTEGKDGFYKGRVAQAIVDLIQGQGGLMTLEDLAAHKTDVVDPISYTYANDVKVWECPPNGQGITALMALGILEAAQEQGTIKSLLDMEHNSAEYLHALIEALRLAFADSLHWVTDPDCAPVSPSKLLSKEYLLSRAKHFNPQKAIADAEHGNPINSSDTVYFTAIPKGCGFTLQNRGCGFVLNDPSHPNILKASHIRSVSFWLTNDDVQGGKRPYHTIIPALVTRGDELFLSYGVMGGFMQPQGHVQVLLNMLRGWTPQDALDAPRFCISPGLPDAPVKESTKAGDINSEVYFEPGISNETIQTLRAMGHDARPVTGIQRALMGRGQIIQRLKTSDGSLVWAAGSDLRGDGHATPQI